MFSVIVNPNTVFTQYEAFFINCQQFLVGVEFYPVYIFIDKNGNEKQIFIRDKVGSC